MDSGIVKKNYNQSINRPVAYLVPHTHYDAIWVFTKEDYFYINIELILKQVIDLIKGHNEYKFTIEQTFLLEHIESNYPKLLASAITSPSGFTTMLDPILIRPSCSPTASTFATYTLFSIALTIGNALFFLSLLMASCSL